MSGRRLRKSIKQGLIRNGLGNNDTIVIQSGPANGYAVSAIYKTSRTLASLF